jgi:hypothetical protein
MGMCGCLPAETHKRSSCNLFTGYSQPALYVYAVAISAAGASVCDTMGLFCTDLAMRNDEGYIMQWNRVKRMGDTYVVPPETEDVSFTSLVADDSMLYIHPPRTGRYRPLQFCPYPYFEIHQSAWQFTLVAGSLWATDTLVPIPIDATDTFVSNYRLADTMQNCYGNADDSVVVVARTTSRHGQSTARYCYDAHSGLRNFDVYTWYGTHYHFSLIDKKTGQGNVSFSESLKWLMLNRKHHQQDTGLLVY